VLINPVSPIAFSLGPVAVRWYALAYVAAFVAGFWILKKLMNQSSEIISKKRVDDLFTALILGVIIGGRLGYVLFYNLPFFLAHPLEIFAVWHGGMSFHGGLLGVIAAVLIFASREVEGRRAKFAERRSQSEGELSVKRSKLSLLLIPSLFALRPSTSRETAFRILDMISVVAPIGLFFGRIANFVNMEVMGRATDRPWGVVFAGSGDATPRHPSPLYEAALEGLLLFAIMFCLWRWTRLRERAGAISGIFAMLYAAFRIFAEQFRAPDAHIGFIAWDWLTMGMLLSAAMFVVGSIVLAVAMRRK
jgi:phosphatidylglycerol:prolipoprotein diacylglycerol transferase